MNAIARDHRGFTIVELISVLAIIALLIALVFVGFRTVRISAQKTETLSSLKSVMRGYASYQLDHNGRLLPGFLDQAALDGFATSGRSIDAFDLGNNRIVNCAGNLCDASSYVWRLMPYLDNDWDVLTTDYSSKAMDQHLKGRLDTGVYGHASGGWPVGSPLGSHLSLGATPAFGLNSIYLGGDSFHGSAATQNQNPWNPATPGVTLAATNASAVRNPAQLITFAPARYRQEEFIGAEITSTFSDAPVDDPLFGYCELRPPWVFSAAAGDYVQQWFIDQDNVGQAVVNPAAFANGGGVPISRAGAEKIPVAHFDGSTILDDFNTIAGPTTLPGGIQRDFTLQQIMSRWSPFVTAPAGVQE